MKSTAGYETVPFPKVRRAITDFLYQGHRKHTIHGLLDVDVTEPRRFLREHKARTAESLSFTAFVIGCVAKAVDENRLMHAYRSGGTLVLFDEVDVATLVERETMGHRMGVVHVIRAANTKDFRRIHEEVRTAQAQKVEETPGFRGYQLAFMLPSCVRRWMWGRLMGRPRLWKRFGGTVVVSAVGMFGHGGGWGIPITSYTLSVALGGIADRPGIVEGRIEPREYLGVTVSVDHDIIDGVPLARFLTRLRELIESCHGLS